VVAEPGVLIVSVTPNSPAATAGLKRGDIVLKVDDQPVNQAAELAAAIQAAQVGDLLTLTVQRGDAQQEFTLTVGERRGAAYVGVVPYGPLLSGGREGPQMWQAPLPPAAPGHKFAFSQTVGAHIIAVLPESPAAEAGLVKGDLIVEVDGDVLTPAVTVPSLLEQYKPGDQITLQVQSKANDVLTKTVTITLGEHPQEPDRAYLGVRLAPQIIFHMENRKFAPGSEQGKPGPGRRFRFMRPYSRPLPPFMPMLPYHYWFGHPGYGMEWCQPAPGDMLFMQPVPPPMFEGAPGEFAAPEVEIDTFEFIPGNDPGAPPDVLLESMPSWGKEGPEI
jgi:membrane-associated protease RseP (regulator of RpoE activity)